jgi:hypothetical protein
MWVGDNEVQDVMLQAMAKKITWWQVAEILGISDRHMRRWRERYEEEGYNGLLDRRRGKPSRRRVPLARVEKVFALYRGKYSDLNVQHFREAASGTRDRTELHLGEAGAAGGEICSAGDGSVACIANGSRHRAPERYSFRERAGIPKWVNVSYTS